MLKFRYLQEDVTPPTRQLHAIGDIHGMYDVMMKALRNQGLVDEAGNWAGGNSVLVFTGDYMDRGPHGIEVLRKIKELQEQAQAKGGEVVTLLGNHDIYFFGLARLLYESGVMGTINKFLHHYPKQADIFNARSHNGTGDTPEADKMEKDAIDLLRTMASNPHYSHPVNPKIIDAIAEQSLNNGMSVRELLELANDKDLLEWCLQMPLMAKRGRVLFQHVNGGKPYTDLLDMIKKAGKAPPGADNIDALNEWMKQKMATSDLGQYGALFNHFTSDDSRKWDGQMYKYMHEGGQQRTKKAIEDQIATFAPDATKVAHGHSQHNSDAPLEYADGKGLNLDVGLYYYPGRREAPNRMANLTNTEATAPTPAAPAKGDSMPEEPKEPTSPVSEPAAPEAPRPATPPRENATRIDMVIDQLIDAWVKELKMSLINPMTAPENRRGVWDRFKNWLSNMWHGRYNITNPYVWHNKLGDDLGSSVATENVQLRRPTLSEYRSINSTLAEMEEALFEAELPAGTENLRLVHIIDAKAQELKAQIKNLLSKTVEVPGEAPRAAVPEPAPMRAAPRVDPEVAADAEEAEERAEKAEKKEPAAPTAASPSPVVHPSHTFVDDFLDQLVARKTITSAQKDDFLKRLTSGNEEEVKRANEELHQIISRQPEEKKTSLNPRKPDTGNRTWNQLSPEERMMWNAYGGGTAQRMSGWLPAKGVRDLPWVLRIGDPRWTVLEDQPKQYWLRKLKDQGRVELPNEPIETPEELRRRTEQAKEEYNKWREGVSAIKKKARERSLEPRAVSPEEERERSSSAAPEPESPAAPAPAPVEPAAPRTAEIEAPPPNEPRHSPDNALSTPAHRTTDVEAPAAPGGGGKTPKQRKEELRARIERVTDEESRRQLLRELKRAKTSEGLADIERQLGQEEAIAGLSHDDAHDKLTKGELDFEWTLRDRTNLLKERLYRIRIR